MEIAASETDEGNLMKAEFAVGLRKRLPIKWFKAEEVRFEIPKVIFESDKDEDSYTGYGWTREDADKSAGEKYGNGEKDD